MIDPVIRIFVSGSVSYSCKMDHGIATLQKGLPVKRYGQIWKQDADYIAVFKGGRCLGCSDYLMTLRSEVGYEMASNEAVAASHKH